MLLPWALLLLRGRLLAEDPFLMLDGLSLDCS